MTSIIYKNNDETTFAFHEINTTQGKYDLNGSVDFVKREMIREVLQLTGYNQVHSAKMLGINRNTLAKDIKRLKIPMQARRPNVKQNTENTCSNY